jgi:hypothetical protein
MDIKEMLIEPEKYIPKKTFYCYDENGICPFWENKSDLPVQENGYCHYLGKSDYDLNEEYNKECKIIYAKNKDEVGKTIEEIFDLHFPSSLIWDRCKECGINDEIDEEDLA